MWFLSYEEKDIYNNNNNYDDDNDVDADTVV